MLEQTSDTYIGLSLVSRLLYRALHIAPDEQFLSDLYKESLFSDWPVELTDPNLISGLALLEEAPLLSRAKSDFADLFIGPGKLGAAPWASVYLTEEQITFGEQTLAIRRVYSQFGVEINTGEREPDDHIGLIFSFIAHLCELAAQQLQENQNSPTHALRSLLTDHVLTWAPTMLQAMHNNASTNFYRGIALVAEGTLRQLAKLVKAQYLIVPLYR